MKECFKCKEVKPLIEFSKNKSKKDGLNAQCKLCHTEYRRNHYLANKQKYIDKANKNRQIFAEWFDEFKKTLSCLKCKESRHWVLDFHHRNPKEKDKSISVLRSYGNKERILNELKKCDVLCSNCHRDLHYNERN